MVSFDIQEEPMAKLKAELQHALDRFEAGLQVFGWELELVARALGSEELLAKAEEIATF